MDEFRESHTFIWHGEPNRVVIELTDPGMEDHRHHFEILVLAFYDKRCPCL
jgi:hypothetical protein